MDEPANHQPAIHKNASGIAARSPAVSAGIGFDLTGNLPCIGCGYNLRGLTISGVCSECGTPIRASILAQVDPMAEQLQPIRRPRLVSTGMILWSWGAVVAALLVWVTRLIDVSNELFSLSIRFGSFRQFALLGIASSMLGAMVLIKPTAIMRTWECCKAIGAVLAYIPLLVMHHKLQTGYDLSMGPPFIGPDLLIADRSLLRLAEGALVIVIILGLRGNAIALAERSLVMRLGRVDTQPLIALVWSMLLAMGGDALVLAFGSGGAAIGGIVETIALVMISVGSFLFTIGLIGVGVDCVRLRPVLLEPAPGLTDIFQGDPGPPRGSPEE